MNSHKQKINHKEALRRLQNKTSVKQEDIDFSNSVGMDEVLEFNKYGIEVPEHLIEYDDASIDTSDIPEITQKDIETGRLKRVLNARVRVDNEIVEWLNATGTDYNELLEQLLDNFYQSLKILPENKVS